MPNQFGPGPQNFIQGDKYQGFYGEVLQSELIDGQSLQDLVELTYGIPQNNNTEWLKFAIDEKIIYTTKKTIRYNLSWNNLNDLNLIDGSKIITINGFDYRIRLFRGQNSNPYDPTLPDKDQINSEWNRLILPIHENQPNNFRYPQFVDPDLISWNINYTDEDLLLSQEYGNGFQTLTQEESLVDSNKVMIRGYYGPESVSDANKTDITISIGWRPVLELVGINQENGIYTITTNTTGRGQIKVIPNKDEYIENEPVTIQQIPVDSYEFLNWSGDLSGTEPEKIINIHSDINITQHFSDEFSIERNIELDKQRHLEAVFRLKDSEYDETNDTITNYAYCTRTYTAYFEKLNYSLSYTTNDPDMGMVSGSIQQTYEHGDPINIKQEQNVGYEFVKWVNAEDNSLFSEEQEVTFNITQDTNLIAIFEPILLHVTVNIEGVGSYIIEPDKTEFNYNETVMVQALQTDGNYQCKEIIFQGETIYAPGHEFNITEDVEITLIFSPQSYNLFVDVFGEGSYTLSPDKPEYEYNEEVTITQIPDPGWKLLNWDNNPNETGDTYTVIMDSDKDVFINLERIKYYLTVQNVGDGTGTITINPEQEYYYYNDVVTIVQIPDEHSTFHGMTGDITNNQNTVNITITQDMNIDVHFVQDKYSLTKIINGNGEIQTEPEKDEYMYEEEIQLIQIPDPGWEFVSWDNGSTNYERTIIITDNTQVTQTFQKIEYLIVLSYEGNGTVSKTPEKPIYYYNDEVTINAEPEIGWSFDSWVGDIESLSSSYTFNVTDNMVITGIFTQNFYDLNIDIVGEGTVTKGPSKPQYIYNEEVTLYANPTSGYKFSHWNDDINDTEPTKSIIITDDTTIKATFVPVSLTLTIINDTSKGTVIIEPDQTEFSYGETINIEIIPNEGYIFENVYGDYNTNQSSFSFNIVKNMQITVRYSEKQYTITTRVNPSNSGTVKLNKPNNNYTYNETQIIEQVPNEGYEFSNWSQDITGNTNPYTMNITNNITVQQNFIIQQYTLTLTSNIDGGMLSGQGTYDYNSRINISVTLLNGYQFKQWEDENGNIISRNMNFTYYMPSKDMQLIAIFEPSTYKVSSTVSPQNSGTITGNGFYKYNEEVTLIATQNDGYEFVEWKDARTNSVVSDNSTYTFTMPQKDVNFVAVFSRQSYEVILEQNPPDQGTVSGAGVYQYDEYVYIGAYQNEEYEFLYWKDTNGNLISNNPNYSFRMPSQNITYIAYFEKYDRKLILETNILMDVTLHGQGNYKTGDVVNISQTVPQGYEFVHWKDKDTNEIVSEIKDFQYTIPNVDKTLIAIFDPLGIELIVESNIEDAATLFGAGVYKLYDVVLVYFDLHDGYRFVRWVDENNVLLSENQYFNYTILDEYNYVKAIFEPTEYTLNIDIIGNGQVIKNPDKQSYYYNEIVELTQVSDEGYDFKYWSGDIAGFRNPMYVRMLDSLNISQTFGQQTFSIFTNIQGNGNGFIEIIPNQQFFEYGTDVTIKAIPDEDSIFKQWTGDITSNNQEEIFKIYDDTYITQIFDLKLKGDLEIKYPLNNQEDLPLEVDIQWDLYNQNQDITNIDYEIYVDGLYKQTTKNKNYILRNLTYDQEYQIKIKQKHENGELQSKTIKFKTKTQEDEKTFEIITPVNNMIYISNIVNIIWEQAIMPFYLDVKDTVIEINDIKSNKHFVITLEEEDKGDIWYEIYIDQKEIPDTLVQETFNETHFEYDISNLEFGIYYIRIKAINKIGEEIYSSNIGSFIKYLNEDIYIEKPTELEILPKSYQLLKWVDHNIVPGYYKLYIVKDEKEKLELSENMIDQTYTTNETEYLQDIEISGKYYMKVIKYNSEDKPIQMSPIRTYYLVSVSKPVMYQIPEQICRENEIIYIDLNEYILDNHNLPLTITIKDNDGLNIYLNDNNILQYQWDISDTGLHTITIEAENSAKLKNEMSFNILVLVPPSINRSYFY